MYSAILRKLQPKPTIEFTGLIWGLPIVGTPFILYSENSEIKRVGQAEAYLRHMSEDFVPIVRTSMITEIAKTGSLKAVFSTHSGSLYELEVAHENAVFSKPYTKLIV